MAGQGPGHHDEDDEARLVYFQLGVGSPTKLLRVAQRLTCPLLREAKPLVAEGRAPSITIRRWSGPPSGWLDPLFDPPGRVSPDR